jgi:cell division protease FtsH
MVMRWGMSDKVGNIDYAEAHEGYQGNTAGFSVSAETKTLIESEVKRLIDEGYDTARAILLEKAEDFERLAKGLLEYETLTGDEIRKVIAGETLNDGDDAAPPPPSGGLSSLTAIPKTKPRATGDGGMEPEPSA